MRVNKRLLIPTCNLLLKVWEHGLATSLAELFRRYSETACIHRREGSCRVLVNRLGPLISPCNLREETYLSGVFSCGKLSRGSILPGCPRVGLFLCALFGWRSQSKFACWLSSCVFVLVYAVTIFAARNVLLFLFNHILPDLWIGIVR